MSFTAYASAIAGSILTASFWNAQVKNNGLVLKTSINDDGTIKAGGWCLDVLTAEQDVVNNAGLVSIYSKSIVAGVLGTANGLRLTIGGNLRNNSGSPVNLTIQTSFGGTVFGTTTQSIADATNRQSWLLEAFINANGATNAQRTLARWTLGATGNSEQIPTVVSSYQAWEALTIDTSTAKTLDVSVQWGSANASISLKRFAAFLEPLRLSTGF